MTNHNIIENDVDETSDRSHEFEEWIESLPTQTLTDELKQDIIDKYNDK